MFIYNVTVKVEWEIAEDWLKWIREEHAEEVIATGVFHKYQLAKLIQEDESDGPTFVVQYFCNTKHDYLRYQMQFAPGLQQKANKKFGAQFTAFRSVLEIL